MIGTTCEVCGETATIHETVVEGRTVTRRHRCDEHGRESLEAAAFQIEPRLKTDPEAVLNEVRQRIQSGDWPTDWPGRPRP